MTKKVLFVDDEMSVTKVIELFLIHHGYPYVIANSGEEAILALKEHPDIGIIFLDLMMPGVSGYDVLEYMKNNNINITTVVQSGLSDTGNQSLAFDLGATDFMPKPYNKNDLFEFIAKYS